MAILAFPPIVPNGVYHIRSVNRSPELYFEWQSNNDVLPAAHKPDSDLQRWEIVGQDDDTYTITNVASKAKLTMVEYQENAETKHAVKCGTSGYWHLDARGDHFTIGVVNSEKCIDLTNDGKWLILWSRYNGMGQRFVLDTIGAIQNPGGNPSATTQPTTKPTGTGSSTVTGSGSGASSTAIQAGIWNIKNRATNGQLAIHNGFEQPEAPVRVWWATYGSTSRVDPCRAWTLTRKGEGYTLSNRFSPGLLQTRFLKDGPVIGSAENICRFIPVPGTEYFHIATSTDPNSRVLQDSNTLPIVNNGNIHMSEYNKDETRQHWVFYTPS